MFVINKMAETFYEEGHVSTDLRRKVYNQSLRIEQYFLYFNYCYKKLTKIMIEDKKEIRMKCI